MEGTATGDAVRAGGPAVAIAAIGVAVLQAAQGLVGSFNPRLEVMALIAIALVTATAAFRRLRARDGEAISARGRGDRLRRSLKSWLPETLASVGPETLGVFPPRRDLSQRYIPRETDAGLRRAVAESGLVIVTGRPGAGKTRSALEALREKLPDDTLMVVPHDGDSLRALLEVDPQLRHVGDPGKRRVLWLDGIGRYLSSQGAGALLRLASRQPGNGSPRVTIVATSRDSTWHELLESEAAQGEAARSLLFRARVVRVPDQLSAGELAAAKERYPVLDFSKGIGKALGRSGEETDADDAGDPPAPGAHAGRAIAINGPRRVHRDRGLMAPAVVCLIAIVIAAGLAATGNFDKPPLPSIAEQATEATRMGAVGPRTVIMREQADLHGSGEISHIFAFGDGADTQESQERADELQVWDRHGDRLELAFRFEPRSEGVFQFRAIDDIDGDGADELVGGYGTELIRGELLLPVALDRDEDTGAYRLMPLIAEPPSLRMAPSDRNARELNAHYESRLTLVDVDEGEGLTLSGFRAQDFVVTPDPQRLIAAYVREVSEGGETRLVEVKSHTFDMTGGRPDVRPCRLSGSDIVTMRVPTSNARLLHRALLERWLTTSKGRYCVIQL